MQTQQDEIEVPMDLARRLTGWHSSMGDPVYAVSSSGLANRPVPRETFEAALANIVKHVNHPAHAENNMAEIREIQLQMKGILGQVKDDAELREAIARCMARTYWAMAWADEAEENHEEVNLSGVDIFHVAPETPKRALEGAYKDIEGYEKHAGKTIVEIYAPYASHMTPFDFGYEVASSLTGSGGGELSLDTPYGEMPDYYQFADKWIAE